MNRRHFSLVLGSFIAVLSACTSETPAQPDAMELRAERGDSSQPSFLPPLTLDEQWARIASSDIPGFAGVVRSEDGTDEILLSDIRHEAKALEYFRGRQSLAGASNSRLRTRPVEFGFDRLMKWRLLVLPFLGAKGISMLDLDEKQNRLLIGVTDPGDVAQAARLSDSLGIPRSAVLVAVVPRGELRQTLRNAAPSVIGGYEIIGVGRGACSHGFNTLENGTNGNSAFVTASHCSAWTFSTEGTSFAQPVGGPAIGYETLDPSLGGGYWSFYGRAGLCAPFRCRFSDATLVRYHGGISHSRGAVAKTTSAGYGAPGSVAVVGSWQIFNKLPMSFLTMGRWLNKVGRTSGWTRGQVTRTCFDHADATRTLLCQWESTIWSEPGDSGSPIFLDADQHPTVPISSVHLAGLLWGGPAGNWNVTWFSALDGIERDFGRSFTVCDPSFASC